MKIYVSIDLDFWNNRRDMAHEYQFLVKALSYVPKSRIHVMDSHENMLKSVNASGCDELINIDWHSDISNRFDPNFKNDPMYHKINCGTWVNFVKWRNKGKYTWIHPYAAEFRAERGYCHAPVLSEHNPFLHPELGGWLIANQKRNKNPFDIIPWSFVDSIGIAFSYDWIKFERQGHIAGNVLGYQPMKDKNPKLY